MKSLQCYEKIKVNPNTVRRVLQRNGLAVRVKRKKLLFSKKYYNERLNFAKRFKD